MSNPYWQQPPATGPIPPTQPPFGSAPVTPYPPMPPAGYPMSGMAAPVLPYKGTAEKVMAIIAGVLNILSGLGIIIVGLVAPAAIADILPMDLDPQSQQAGDLVTAAIFIPLIIIGILTIIVGVVTLLAGMFIAKNPLAWGIVLIVIGGLMLLFSGGSSIIMSALCIIPGIMALVHKKRFMVNLQPAYVPQPPYPGYPR